MRAKELQWLTDLIAVSVCQFTDQKRTQTGQNEKQAEPDRPTTRSHASETRPAYSCVAVPRRSRPAEAQRRKAKWRRMTRRRCRCDGFGDGLVGLAHCWSPSIARRLAVCRFSHHPLFPSSPEVTNANGWWKRSSQERTDRFGLSTSAVHCIGSKGTVVLTCTPYVLSWCRLRTRL